MRGVAEADQKRRAAHWLGNKDRSMCFLGTRELLFWVMVWQILVLCLGIRKSIDPDGETVHFWYKGKPDLSSGVADPCADGGGRGHV